MIFIKKFRSLEYLEEVAVFIAKKIASGEISLDRESKKGTIQKLTDSVMGIGFVKNLIFNKAREQITKATKGFYPAPLKALEVSLIIIRKLWSIKNNALKLFRNGLY